MSGMAPEKRSRKYIGLRHDGFTVDAALDSDETDYSPVLLESMSPARARRLAAELISRANEIDPPHTHWWQHRQPSFATYCMECGEMLQIDERVAYVHPRKEKK